MNMFSISGVETEKVSLVTKDYTPAVKKATTKWALFKWYQPKKKIDMEKITELQKRLGQ